MAMAMAFHKNGKKASSFSDHSQILIQDPHFLTVVTSPSNDMDIKIPYAFMRKHGRDLKNEVLLKVPCNGARIWKVKLFHNHENGTTFLQKGWKEFAEYYSVEKFYLVVFRYQGNSEFLVLIFDPSALEIKYPEDDIVAEFSYHDLEENHGKRNRKKQRTQVEDIQEDDEHSVGILDDFTPFNPTRKKKRNNVKTRSPKESSTPRLTNFSEPFFIAVLKPSHLSHSMEIPKNFAREYMSLKGERHSYTFCVAGKTKTWTVISSSHHNHTAKGRKRFDRSGWRKFVKDNGLKVGDVCVFELVKLSRKFNITVYRSG